MSHEVKLKEWGLFKPNWLVDYNTHDCYYVWYGLPTSIIFLWALYLAF
nr:hypothetical protein [uncultured Prevotella sp.]